MSKDTTEEGLSKMADNRPLYHSYLLRVWFAQEQKQTVWRASLENPRTREVLGFTSLERLFAFLQDQTAVFDEDDEQNKGQR